MGIILANLQWSEHKHCPAPSSQACCWCHHQLDSDLRGLLALQIFLPLSVDQKLDYFLSHRDWPFVGMFAVGTTVEDNKIKHEWGKIHNSSFGELKIVLLFSDS